MNIEFDETEKLFKEMQDAWNTIEDAFFKTHYELSEETTYDALSWRSFLTHPKVTDWLNQEMSVVQQAKLRALMKDLDGNSKSTGLPQLINALSNQVDKTAKSMDGPIFIYTYVPLNEQEKHAENVRFAEADIIKDITSI